MRLRSTLAAALSAALLLAPAVAVALVTKQVVRGKMEAVADDSSDAAKGRFRIRSNERGDNLYESIRFWGARLDAEKDDDGKRPEYHVWLVDADEEVEADFGQARLNGKGRSAFRFHTRRDVLPDDVDAIRDFGGGTIQLRLGDDVVLEGDVPDFIGITDDNEEGSHQAARAKAATRLKATDDGGKARGFIRARIQNRPRGTESQIRVKVVLLGKARDVFYVVAIDDDDEETKIGRFQVRSRLGIGSLFLDTRRDDEIPGGDILDLGGQDVEVRDADGTVVMTGTFPSLE